MKKNFLLGLMLIIVSCQSFAQEKKTETIKVAESSLGMVEKLPLVADRSIKNVILIISDGTGLAQITSGQYSQVGTDGYLELQKMPISGIVRTHSANGLITDSAAGATAYSCGAKTNNGMIGWLPDGTSCKTILELAEGLGKSTGLVATSTITHATPSSFASHVVSRSMQNTIAEQYLNSGVDVFMGGGREFFIPQNMEGSSRKDDKNLIEEFRLLDYQYVENSSELNSAKNDKILGLFALQGMNSMHRTPTLEEMTSKALSVLNTNDNGFFLMVEASQVDWGGHENDSQYVLREVKDLDAAVKAALDFAQVDGETLVVLTSDHETGGMTFQGSYDKLDELEVYWTTGSHTGIPIPLMAFGPHAVKFSGWHDNTDIGKLISKLAGYGTLPITLE